MKKLPFGVNCLPVILNATLQHHIKQEWLAADIEEVRRVIELLLWSFYVDDSITSVTSLEKVIHFQQTSGEVLARAGMEATEVAWRDGNLAGTVGCFSLTTWTQVALWLCLHGKAAPLWRCVTAACPGQDGTCYGDCRNYQVGSDF